MTKRTIHETNPAMSSRRTAIDKGPIGPPAEDGVYEDDAFRAAMLAAGYLPHVATEAGTEAPRHRSFVGAVPCGGSSSGFD